MDHEFLSIVEKLAILEGRIAPKDNAIAETATKQKKPALFNNLKKDESAIPMVGGVEFAEEKSTDVLSQVRASLADYLKNAEENIKQDRDLLAKKKQDLDLKKKELRDLELQSKESVEETDPANTLEAVPDMLEEPNQTPAGGEGVANEVDPTYAQGGNSTYAESMTAPVKTMNVPLDEMGGSVLVEIHGDERSGFCIKRAGKEMATRFATLEQAEMALEMYNAHRAKMAAANQSADYVEEK